MVIIANHLNSLHVEESQKFVLAKRGKTSRAWGAGKPDTDCDPEEMVESRFFGTEDECGPTVNINGNERVPMKNGIIDAVT